MTLEDERIRFYLRHRDQIEQWASLRGEAAAALDEWLLSLRPHIEAQAAELDASVVVRCFDDPDFAWPSFRLFRREWNVTDDGHQQPCVALEWGRGKTNLRGVNAPCIGVRAHRDDRRGSELRAREEFKRARTGRADSTALWFAAYAYRLPSRPFPEDEEAYRTELVDALRGAWETYAPIIDTLTSDH